MFRARRALSPMDVAWRLLAPVLTVTLLLSGQAIVATPVEAGGGGGAAALRARQVEAEADMRRADQQIKKLLRLRREHRHLLNRARQQLESAIRQRDRARQRVRTAETKLSRVAIALARKTQVRPDPRGRQAVKDVRLRKQVRTQRLKVQEQRTTLRAAERKVDKARALKQSRLKRPPRDRIAKRVAERERAEDRLSSAISAMLSLSKQRAGRVQAASGKRFRKPVVGSVSQPYGCTGYHVNPRRGSCRHFHDGLDIAARKGKPVRASADGYVAYAGFSPWDANARAYIVIIGHRSGYETVYAHLKPRATVRAGQRVESGDVVGRVGMTGTTSGPHVHWEVKLRGSTVNPLKARR